MGTIWENENLKIHLAIESTAACCSVLQRVAACCSVLQCGQVISPLNRLLGVAVCCSVLQCVAVCCSVLHGVAGFYSHLATGFTIYKNHTANFWEIETVCRAIVVVFHNYDDLHGGHDLCDYGNVLWVELLWATAHLKSFCGLVWATVHIKSFFELLRT